MKKLLSIAFLSFVFMQFVAAQDVTTTINTLYTSYIRPALIVIVFVVFVVTGIIKYSDFIEGGQAAKQAFFSCMKMALYPFVVLAIAEGLRLLLQ